MQSPPLPSASRRSSPAENRNETATNRISAEFHPLFAPDTVGGAERATKCRSGPFSIAAVAPPGVNATVPPRDIRRRPSRRPRPPARSRADTTVHPRPKPRTQERRIADFAEFPLRSHEISWQSDGRPPDRETPSPAPHRPRRYLFTEPSRSDTPTSRAPRTAPGRPSDGTRRAVARPRSTRHRHEVKGAGTQGRRIGSSQIFGLRSHQMWWRASPVTRDLDHGPIAPPAGSQFSARSSYRNETPPRPHPSGSRTPCPRHHTENDTRVHLRKGARTDHRRIADQPVFTFRSHQISWSRPPLRRNGEWARPNAPSRRHPPSTLPSPNGTHARRRPRHGRILLRLPRRGAAATVAVSSVARAGPIIVATRTSTGSHRSRPSRRAKAISMSVFAVM